MKPEYLRGIYKEIAIRTDIETALKIHTLFNGQQIAFPKKLYCTEYVISSVKKEFNGRNIRELAVKFNLSERRIKQILNS